MSSYLLIVTFIFQLITLGLVLVWAYMQIKINRLIMKRCDNLQGQINSLRGEPRKQQPLSANLPLP
jgi:hypothetical protein